MFDAPQLMEHRGAETIYPIRHDPKLEATQRQAMAELNIQAPKVILTTLPHGETLTPASCQIDWICISSCRMLN